jgi:hypothetical protein
MQDLGWEDGIVVSACNKRRRFGTNGILRCVDVPLTCGNRFLIIIKKKKKVNAMCEVYSRKSDGRGEDTE